MINKLHCAYAPLNYLNANTLSISILEGFSIDYPNPKRMTHIKAFSQAIAIQLQ